MQKHTLHGLNRQERNVFRVLAGHSHRMPFFGTHFNRTGCVQPPPRTAEYLIHQFVRNGLLTVHQNGQPVTRVNIRSRHPYDFTLTPRGRQIAIHHFTGK